MIIGIINPVVTSSANENCVCIGRHYLHTGKCNDKPNHDFRVGTMGNVRSQDDIHCPKGLLCSGSKFSCACVCPLCVCLCVRTIPKQLLHFCVILSSFWDLETPNFARETFKIRSRKGTQKWSILRFWDQILNVSGAKNGVSGSQK